MKKNVRHRGHPSQRFKIRSCALKVRYSIEPPAPNMAMRAYPCDFCGGWHLARRTEEPAPMPTEANHD